MRHPGRSDGESRVTIEDVARSAAVSTATVSRVLNGAGRVRSDRRARVRAAIEALGYVPNAAARALSSLRSGLIGIEVSNLSEHATLVAAAIARLEHAGFAALVREHRPPRTHDRGSAPFAGLDLEGRLLVGDAAGAEAGARRMPSVVCGGDGQGDEPSVNVDLGRAAATVAGYLGALGHRRIGLVWSVTSTRLGRRFLSEFRFPGPRTGDFDLRAACRHRRGPRRARRRFRPARRARRLSSARTMRPPPHSSKPRAPLASASHAICR